MPHAPSKPQVTAVNATSVTLKWRPPTEDGGSPITGYVVQKKERLALRWTPVNSTPTTEAIFTVTGLMEKSEYEFRVVTENKRGFGQPSESTESVLVKPPYGKAIKWTLFCSQKWVMWYNANDKCLCTKVPRKKYGTLELNPMLDFVSRTDKYIITDHCFVIINSIWAVNIIRVPLVDSTVRHKCLMTDVLAL